MSSRALRRLREEKEAEAAALATENEEDESSSEEEEEERGGGGFMQMLEEEDSESESESSSDDDEVVVRPIVKPTPKVEEEKVEEDLDDILNDMNISQIADHNADLLNPTTVEPTTIRALLLSKSKGFDVQDMDVDYSMRSLLGGGAPAAAFAGVDDPFAMEGEQQQQRNRGRNQRGQRGKRIAVTKKYIFGKPKAEWGKPPSYVGGGFRIMKLIPEILEEERDAWVVPWPYNLKNDSDDGEEEASQKWYSLQMSDTYQEQNKLYEELLGSQGAGADPNSLAMFVADQPYFAETLLQLAMVLYYVNDRGRGSDLLRRCMYVYESALPSNILPTVASGKKDDKEVNENDKGEILIDIDRSSNSGLFATLFRVMQTAGMGGCHNSALATGRYLLSLDPLRDPMGVLLILDYYALASRRTNSLISDGGEEGSSFIVDLVDSDFLKIHYKDPLTDRHHQCSLNYMPNWAYSYALALYRLSMNEDSENAEEIQDRAEGALVYALRKFPMVLPKLLAMNNVNVEDRSMIMDWQTILPLYNADANSTASSTTIDDRVSRASGEHLVRIFVQRCHKLWKEEDVIKWLYACAHRVVEEQAEEQKKKPSSKGEEQEEDDLQAAIALSMQQDETAEPNTTPTTTATNKSYKEGQQVLYTNSQGSSYATIKKVHLDDEMQPYYTIAVEGREKQTDDAHLSIAVDEVEKGGPLTSTFSIALARYAQCDPTEYEDTFHTFNPEAIALNPNLVAPAMALDPNGRRRFIRRGQQQQQLEEQMGAQDPMDIIRRLLGQAANSGGAPEEPLDPDSPLLQLYLQSLLPWNQVEGIPPPRQA